jgi:hypothetical protein
MHTYTHAHTHTHIHNQINPFKTHITHAHTRAHLHPHIALRLYVHEAIYDEVSVRCFPSVTRGALHVINVDFVCTSALSHIPAFQTECCSNTILLSANPQQPPARVASLRPCTSQFVDKAAKAAAGRRVGDPFGDVDQGPQVGGGVCRPSCVQASAHSDARSALARWHACRSIHRPSRHPNGEL